MMASFDIDKINQAVADDPRALIERSDAEYERKITDAARVIATRLKESPVVLLSGPSGSGKTTTANKLTRRLEKMGIRSHTVSMDDYFRSCREATYPRTPEGDPDFESPLGMDIPLLNQHFEQLARGEEILVPHFQFARQMRDTSHYTPLRVGPDEVVIFEGIHALNDLFAHPGATCLYISARTDLSRGGEVVIPHTWTRFMRRTVRDYNYRGSAALQTMQMWPNIRRGEKLYISPYKDRAQIQFDTSLAYEVPVLRGFAEPLLAALPENAPELGNVRTMLESLRELEPMDAWLVPETSLLREFIR